MKPKQKKLVVIYVPVMVTLLVIGGLLTLVLTAGSGSHAEDVLHGSYDRVDIHREGCDFANWIGHALDEEALEHTGRPFRVMKHGDMMTMDHNPERINIEIDDEGAVDHVWCG